MVLTDSHRMLLQRLLANGATDEHEVRRLARKLTGEQMTRDEVDLMVHSIAESVQPFALDIRRSMYDDGRMYLGVVNTSNDALTTFSSNYKPWEIVFLRKTILEIVENGENGVLDEFDLYNFRENTSIGDVTALLRRLVAEKWLAANGEDATQITIGPRAFLELISFLRDLELKKCAICKYEMLQGQLCASGECETIVHKRCLERFESKGGQFKCVQCRRSLRDGR